MNVLEQVNIDLRKVLQQLEHERNILDRQIAAVKSALDIPVVSSQSTVKVPDVKQPSLKCPRCSRKFHLPIHLGRHVSVAHPVKQSKK